MKDPLKYLLVLGLFGIALFLAGCGEDSSSSETAERDAEEASEGIIPVMEGPTELPSVSEPTSPPPQE